METEGVLERVLVEGKRAIDDAILLIEREERTGADYQPIHEDLQKWGSQGGSVYLGDQKVKVQVPRIRSKEHGEQSLQAYEKLRKSKQFSEELLAQALRGMSAQKYEETVTESAKAFGVSPSSVSRKLVQVTARKLKAFLSRDLSGFEPFAVMIDSIHRGNQAFLVAIGVDTRGYKKVLGFWQGATENHEICLELFKDLERRGLKLSKYLLWVTDGGPGIIKALRLRFPASPHQRCTIHKNRNIQRHLAKKHRKEASKRFRAAMEQTSYEDAASMLKELEKWLGERNESAAASLREGRHELLTLHRLKIPSALRKTLHSTNPIESMFSNVRKMEGNIKRHRDSRMMQRWLGASLMEAEERFRRIRGFEDIPKALRRIKGIHAKPLARKKSKDIRKEVA
jgi:putative transposase